MDKIIWKIKVRDANDNKYEKKILVGRLFNHLRFRLFDKISDFILSACLL